MHFKKLFITVHGIMETSDDPMLRIEGEGPSKHRTLGTVFLISAHWLSDPPVRSLTRFRGYAQWFYRYNLCCMYPPRIHDNR